MNRVAPIVCSKKERMTTAETLIDSRTNSVYQRIMEVLRIIMDTYYRTRRNEFRFIP